MESQKNIILLIACIWLVCGASVYAQTPNAIPQPGTQTAVTGAKSGEEKVSQCDCGKNHGYLRKVAYRLGLNDDQKKQLEAAFQKMREMRKASFQQRKANLEALEQELSKSSLDMDKINQLQTERKTLQAQMADAHLNTALEIRKILTSEQYTQFVEFVKKPRPWMHSKYIPGKEERDWKHHRHYYGDGEGNNYKSGVRRHHHQDSDEGDDSIEE